MNVHFNHLKNRILMLEETIKNNIIALENKKTRVTLDEKLAITDSYERLKKLHKELRGWGIGHGIIEVGIQVWEVKPYQLNSLSERKHYTIYYANVSEEEAKELIEIHFPKAEILYIKPITTGTKITKKI